MKLYKALIYEANGCDYTIACGYKMIDLESKNSDDAFIELYRIIEEGYSSFDTRIVKATVFEISGMHEVNMASVNYNIKIMRERKLQLESEEKERLEYERLKSKFGA